MEALTFIVSLEFVDVMLMVQLLIAECYSTLREVVRRHLHSHFVAGENLDVVHAHLARDMGGDFMPVFKLHAKHRV